MLAPWSPSTPTRLLDPSLVSSTDADYNQNGVYDQGDVDVFRVMSEQSLAPQIDPDVLLYNATTLIGRLSDATGAPVPLKAVSVELVHVPQYTPGYRVSDAGCFTKAECGGVLASDTTRYAFYKDFGLNGAQAGYTADCGSPATLANCPKRPRMAYPITPHATTFSMSSDGSGSFPVGIAVHNGHPGLYAVAVHADGVQPGVLLYPTWSDLRAITITQEPESP